MANNHQPFEAWIFSGVDLNPEEDQELQEHLQGCAPCQELAQTWGDLERYLQDAPVVGPAAGFTARWEARLSTDLIRNQRKHTLYAMLFSVGGAVSLLVLVVALLLPLLRTPLPLVLAWAYDFTGVFSYFSQLGEAIIVFLSTIFGVFPTTFWVAVLVAFGSMSVLWSVVFRRLTSPRRVNI